MRTFYFLKNVYNWFARIGLAHFFVIFLILSRPNIDCAHYNCLKNVYNWFNNKGLSHFYDNFLYYLDLTLIAHILLLEFSYFPIAKAKFEIFGYLVYVKQDFSFSNLACLALLISLAF